MARTFVTQENPQFDYSPLGEYGEPLFITTRDFSSAPNSLFNEDLVKIIKGVMERFNVDEDYLVPSGSPLITAFCMMALRDAGVKRFPILRWSNRDQLYVPIVINF